MPKKSPKKKAKILVKHAPLSKTKKTASKSAKAPELLEDEDEMMGEQDEFLDEDKLHERLPVKIRIGERVQEVEEEGIEAVEDRDELAPWEEGFMEGAERQGEHATCARCGKILGDKEEVVEREFHEEIFFFCSEKCARAGPQDQHSRQE